MRTYQQTETYKNDRNFGCGKEVCLLGIIQNRFDGSLNLSPTRYSTFDYVGTACCVELKSRRCKKCTFPDTMINYNKIQAMLCEPRHCYCVFSFLDGNFFVEITPEIVKQFRKGTGGRCDRGQIEQQMYYFIPVNLLSPLELPSDDK